MGGGAGLERVAIFAVGAALGAVAVLYGGDLRDQFTGGRRMACVPETAICVGKPLRSIDVNRAENGLIFLTADRGSESLYLSDLIARAAIGERVVLRFARGKRITRVSVEAGRIVAIQDAPDITYP